MLVGDLLLYLFRLTQHEQSPGQSYLGIISHPLPLFFILEHVELVKRTMAGIKLPILSIPAWANEISDEQWQNMVQRTLQDRQSQNGFKPEWK